MQSAIDAIRRLHDHRRWARAEALALVRPMDDASQRRSFQMGPGSVMGVLVHCYGAEVVWLQVLEKIDSGTNLPNADAFPSLAALEAAWQEVDARWERYFARLTHAQLDEAAVRRRGDREFTTTVAEVLMHVCTHQHYHMAQLVNMLRQLEALPEPRPSLDFITMARASWTARG